ncbi:MAG TPA: adenylate/guanylate cyclase domain-containing protein [Gaiellaceae bacterium]|nr:adenylate/guanylate cyclase domain-containing protein [Gaiellaceae bacterium]
MRRLTLQRRRASGSEGSSQARLRVALFLAVGLAMTGFAFVAYATNLLRPLELSSVDARFGLRGTQPTPEEFVVVEIDAATFIALQHTWPFPRSLHARLIDKLSAGGARAIAYDVQFSEPTEVKEDNALIEAVARAGDVVLAATEVDDEGRGNVFGGADLGQFNTRAANALLPPDPGSVMRRATFSVDGLKSLSVATAEVALGREVPAKPASETQWIDFRGPPGTFKSVSFSDVLDGKVPPSTFRNRIVVVGPSAPSLHDVHATPTSSDELMSGPELQANAIWTVLNGYPLKSAPPWLVAILIALFGFLAPVASLRLSFVTTILLPVTVGVAFTVATQLGFEQGTVLPFTYPMAALVLSTVGAVGTHYSVAAFERARTRDVFSRFVPEEVVKQVLARTDRDLRLGGVDIVGTIMFTDLRGFTTFSEQLEAARVIDIVNVYLTEMSEAILAHGGTLVSYAGDGIMAVFGAPIEQQDHADRAVAAAKEMVAVRLPRVNEFVSARGYGDGFRMGIGVHSGPFIAGNIGSERRLEYTAIGDTVNAASRIEGLTKGTRHMLLFSEATQVLMISPPTDDFVFFAEHELRGRQAALRLFSLESVSDPLLGTAPAPASASSEDEIPPEIVPGIAAV